MGDFIIANILAEGVSSDITIRASNGIGDGAASDIKTITPTSDFSLTSTVNGEVEINGASESITLTITNPAIFATYDSGEGPGVFIATSADIANVPVVLVPPQIADVADVDIGTTLTVSPGLWVYDGDNAEPTITYRWLRDGVAITGATQTTYDLVSEDAGQPVVVEETASDTNGTRMSVSDAVILSAAVNPILLVDNFETADGYV